MEEIVIDVINKRLKERNLTQVQLANKIGKTAPSMNRLLKGISSMSINDLNVISKALGSTSLAILEEAQNKVPSIEVLSKKNESFVLSTNLSFDLWNFLKERKSSTQLYQALSSYTDKEIKAHLDHFLKEKLITLSADNTYSININRTENIYFSHSKQYLQRKTSTIIRSLNQKPNLDLLNPREKKLWINQYSDGFIVGYFTKEQCDERKVIIRQLWNHLISQININNNSPDDNNKKELRMFSIMDLAYPLGNNHE